VSRHQHPYLSHKRHSSIYRYLLKVMEYYS
jgi:hypothetical protein